MKKHKMINRRQALKIGSAALTGTAFGLTPFNAMASTDSFDAIKKRGYLLYGFNGERPYNYMDAEGNLVGSEIEIARKVAKDIGIEEVQGVAMNFDSFIPAILAGRIDTCLPIFVKPARCEKIAYARPHLIEGQSAIVSKGNPHAISGWDDLVSKDIKIGLISGTTPNEIAKAAGVASEKIVRFPDTTTLTAGIKSARVDIIVEASSTIRLINEALEGSDTERLSSWTKPSNYSGSIEFFAAYPFSQTANELRSAFDNRLTEILASGELDKIAAPFGFSSADRPAAGSPSLEKICAG